MKRNRERVLRAAPMLALVALAAACTSLLPAPPPAPNLHVLDAKPSVAAAPQRRDLVLEVGAPVAWPGFDSARIAYVRKPHAIEYYAANEWADAPARMVGPLVARAIEGTGGFRAVVQPPTTVAADLRLATELVRLQQSFATPPSAVELVLRAQLSDVRTRRVIATRTFEASVPAASEDAYGGVTAANQALGRVLVELASFCVAEAARIPSAP